MTQPPGRPRATRPGPPPRRPRLPGWLSRPAAGGAVWGWAGPLLVTAFGAWLRFGNLAVPRALVFDESYYVPGAYGILRYGNERAVSSQAATLILAGHSQIFLPGAQFAAHPPFGMTQLAAGEWLFGLTPFGWRFAAAAAGSASVLMLARIARRLTGSTLLGCAAGLLLALDGLEFVLSRTAMLDIFVMFWVLAAFGCLVAGRDAARAHAGCRALWWRLAAGACLGLATASKWNGLFFCVLFVPLAIAWSPAGRRATLAGVGRAATAAAGMWLAAAVAYLATWSGWLLTRNGWDRNYAAAHGVRIPVISALYSLLEYHRQMLSYNTGLRSGQSFQSPPWAWPLLRQPVPFYYAAPQYGTQGCRALAGCAQGVVAAAPPAIWWAAVPAVAVIATWWLLRRDWRAGAVLLGVLAGWLPWFAFAARPQFLYYAVSFEPYLILAITLCLYLIAGPAAARWPRRAAATTVSLACLAAVAAGFGYLYPVLSGQTISHATWLARMAWAH
jgi:dolichyl-phosphate-mannose-protein mannosyltransferase